MVYLVDTENVSSQFWMNINLKDGDEIILFVSKKSKPLSLTDVAEVAKGISNGNISVVKTIEAKKKNLMDTILSLLVKKIWLIKKLEIFIRGYGKLKNHLK